MSVTEREIKHRAGGEKNRNRLQSGQPFFQKNCTEEDVHQRRHEVTQTGLQNPSDEHCENKEEPVSRHGYASCKAIKSCCARTKDGTDFRPAFLPEQNG